MGLCHDFKVLFHDIFSQKVLAFCPPLQCAGTLCASPQQQLSTKFWIIQTHQHLPWVALNTARFWCLCLTIYFFEGKGSSAHCPGVWQHWMLPAPGSVISWGASPVLQSPRPVACSRLCLPFPILFPFAGQSMGTPFFAWPCMPVPGQGRSPSCRLPALTLGGGVLLLEPQNLGKQVCGVCF